MKIFILIIERDKFIKRSNTKHSKILCGIKRKKIYMEYVPKVELFFFFVAVITE